MWYFYLGFEDFTPELPDQEPSNSDSRFSNYLRKCQVDGVYQPPRAAILLLVVPLLCASDIFSLLFAPYFVVMATMLNPKRNVIKSRFRITLSFERNHFVCHNMHRVMVKWFVTNCCCYYIRHAMQEYNCFLIVGIFRSQVLNIIELSCFLTTLSVLAVLIYF